MDDIFDEWLRAKNVRDGSIHQYWRFETVSVSSSVPRSINVRRDELIGMHVTVLWPDGTAQSGLKINVDLLTCVEPFVEVLYHGSTLRCPLENLVVMFDESQRPVQPSHS